MASPLRKPSMQLLLLVALLLACALPSARAHCPSNRTCIKTGYFNVTGFKPFSTALTGTPIGQAAQCIDACSRRGYTYFSALSGVCQCFDTCDDKTFIHGAGYAGVDFVCYPGPSGRKGGNICVPPQNGNATTANCGALVRGSTKVVLNRSLRSSYKCCCSAAFPNPVFFDGLLTGCSPSFS